MKNKEQVFGIIAFYVTLCKTWSTICLSLSILHLCKICRIFCKTFNELLTRYFLNRYFLCFQNLIWKVINTYRMTTMCQTFIQSPYIYCVPIMYQPWKCISDEDSWSPYPLEENISLMRWKNNHINSFIKGINKQIKSIYIVININKIKWSMIQRMTWEGRVYFR